MVYHYTNFVAETNIWWLRRVRPLMFVGFGIWFYWLGQRYYFFGKNQATWQTQIPSEEWTRRAQINKRNWGYNAHYEPTLENSMKKVLYQDPNYKFPVTPAERYMAETRSLEQILEDENEQFQFYKDQK